MWPGNLFRVLFNFQRILCKKEPEVVSMLISTNFDSFAITYLKNFIFQQKKFHFPIEAVLNSLQTLKGLFTSQVIQ